MIIIHHERLNVTSYQIHYIYLNNTQPTSALQQMLMVAVRFYLNLNLGCGFVLYQQKSCLLQIHKNIIFPISIESIVKIKTSEGVTCEGAEGGIIRPRSHSYIPLKQRKCELISGKLVTVETCLYPFYLLGIF